MNSIGRRRFGPLTGLRHRLLSRLSAVLNVLEARRLDHDGILGADAAQLSRHAREPLRVRQSVLEGRPVRAAVVGGGQEGEAPDRIGGEGRGRRKEDPEKGECDERSACHGWSPFRSRKLVWSRGAASGSALRRGSRARAGPPRRRAPPGEELWGAHEKEALEAGSVVQLVRAVEQVGLAARGAGGGRRRRGRCWVTTPLPSTDRTTPWVRPQSR